jgi:hypothetical protein
MTVAAIDRVRQWARTVVHRARTDGATTDDRLTGSLHHATILKMNAESFRQRAAASNKRAHSEAPATTITDNQNEGET